MKTALITGAARGIGLSTARAFASAGFRILSLDRQFKSQEEEIIGERIDFDLRDTAQIPALIASLGEIDTLVNNAAVLYCDPMEQIPDE
ncbi:MAG TPA: SDR family oxidoreductase, partial [Bryobacteraceae bacterium]